MMTPSRVFIREATGLTRQLDYKDLFILAGANCYGGLLLWMFTEIPYLYPGVDLISACTFTVILVLIGQAIPYTMMALAVPRTAADYTCMSRVLPPPLAFAASWVWLWSQPSSMVAMILTMGSFYLSTWVGAIGLQFNNPSLVSLASALATTQANVTAAIIVIIVFGLIMMLPLKYGFSYTQSFLFISMTVAVVLFLGLLALNSPTTFASTFNAVSSLPYDKVVTTAVSYGFSRPGFSWMTLILSLPYTTWWLGITFWLTPAVGEVKNPRKSLWIAGLLPAPFMLVWVIVAAPLFYRVIPYDFMNALVWLAYMKPDAYPLPYYAVPTYLASLLTNNIIVINLIHWGFIASWVIYMLAWYIILVRTTFAYSFDRIFPTKLSDVNDRWASPIKATVFWMVISIVMCVVAGYTNIFQFFFANTLLVASSVPPVVLAAALLPYRRKDIFEIAPGSVQKKIGSIPVITVTGIIGFIFYIFVCIVAIVAYPIPTRPENLWVVGIVWVTGFIVYYASKYYHRTKGIDISFAFKEIPPE